MVTLNFADLIGLTGVILALACYARVQWQREFAKSFLYSAGNFLGSGLVVISLLNEWNLASFIGNSVWVLLSLYGMVRCLRYRLRGKETLSRLEKRALPRRTA